MQPVLMLSSPVEGILSLNGRFLGEIRPDAPLFHPVSAYGAAYLQFSPLADGYLPLARRCVFSAGKPVAASLENAKGLCAIAWPFGITELEITPRRAHPSAPETRRFTSGGIACRFVRAADEAYLEIDAAGKTYRHALPANAREPLLAQGDGCLFVSGDTEDGSRYALALSEDASRTLLSVLGREIAFLGSGRIAAAAEVGDLAGHVRRTVYRADRESGEYAVESEELTLPGEYRPQTPAECALIAAEAYQLGLDTEAARCFRDGAQPEEECLRLLRRTSACAALRFSPPDGRSAIGALARVHERYAEAVPLYYQSVLENGEWKIGDLRL